MNEAVREFVILNLPDAELQLNTKIPNKITEL